MKCSVFIATSLDGYIARPDGRIDWLEKEHAKAPPGEDFGFRAFFDSIDVLIVGRKTLEQVLTFPDWYYGDKRVIALSRTWTRLPEGCPATVSLRDRTPKELFRELEAEGVRRAYVDGGTTIGAFLTAGLIDDLTITAIPVLVGAGIRLFGPLAGDVPLALEATRAFDCGFVQSTYRVAKK
jgi:dihydrofolate reductase